MRRLRHAIPTGKADHRWSAHVHSRTRRSSRGRYVDVPLRSVAPTLADMHVCRIEVRQAMSKTETTRKRNISGCDSAKIGGYIDAPCGHGFQPWNLCTNRGVCQEAERNMRLDFVAPRPMTGFDFVGAVMRWLGISP